MPEVSVLIPYYNRLKETYAVRILRKIWRRNVCFLNKN